MDPIKTTEQWRTDLDKAEKLAERMDDACLKETRVIQLLVAAGLVTEEKVEAARELLRDLK